MTQRPFAWSLAAGITCIAGLALWNSTRRSDVALPVAESAPVSGSWTVAKEWTYVGKKEDIAFPDATHGWMVDAGGHILHSADAGRTWEVQAMKLGYLRSVEFIDRQRGFAGTVDGRLYATTNGGAAWAEITKSLPRRFKGFCGMAHVGETVHIVGRYQGATDHLFSPDAGKTWRISDLSALASGLVDVEFLNDSVGFISGMGKPKPPATRGAAIILRTTDGGGSWRPVYEADHVPSSAWKLFATSDSVIYSAIESHDGTHRVAKTTDAGDRWETMTVATAQPPGASLQGVGFIDENTGWVGGYFPGMYATTDGGRTWSLHPLPSFAVNRYAKAGGALVTAADPGVLRYDRPGPAGIP